MDDTDEERAYEERLLDRDHAAQVLWNRQHGYPHPDRNGGQ